MKPDIDFSRSPETFEEFWEMHCKEYGGRYGSFETSEEAEDIARSAWDFATKIEHEKCVERHGGSEK